MQVLITNALESTFPPNTTLVSIDLMQQISNDTVIVASSFVIWQSMVPILLANKCCALEVLYLQHAVARVTPDAIGKYPMSGISFALLICQLARVSHSDGHMSCCCI